MLFEERKTQFSLWRVRRRFTLREFVTVLGPINQIEAKKFDMRNRFDTTPESVGLTHDKNRPILFSVTL